MPMYNYCFLPVISGVCAEGPFLLQELEVRHVLDFTLLSFAGCNGYIWFGLVTREDTLSLGPPSVSQLTSPGFGITYVSSAVTEIRKATC